jgi:transcription elongation factor GreB
MIVGEDEADPDTGRIAWTSPVARALLGAEEGDLRQLPRGEVEIVAVDAAAE